jgi:hypothetical protein
VAEA